jgi:hypothetical protein
MVRNGDPGGPSEVVLDSIDITVPGRKITGIGDAGRITTTAAGVSANSGRPTTIVWAPGSGTASIPLSLNKPSNGSLYLQVKVRVQSGKVNVEVLDRNNRENHETRLFDRDGVTEDVFIRLPAGLKEGEVSFRNSANTGTGARAILLDVVLWEVI